MISLQWDLPSSSLSRLCRAGSLPRYRLQQSGATRSSRRATGRLSIMNSGPWLPTGNRLPRKSAYCIFYSLLCELINGVHYRFKAFYTFHCKMLFVIQEIWLKINLDRYSSSLQRLITHTLTSKCYLCISLQLLIGCTGPGRLDLV